MAKLTPAAQKWLKSQPPDIADRLIELAAGDHWVAVRIAIVLDLAHPLRDVAKSVGRPPIVSDSQIISLRRQGLSYRAIGEALGVSGSAIGLRMKKLRKLGELK